MVVAPQSSNAVVFVPGIESLLVAVNGDLKVFGGSNRVAKTDEYLTEFKGEGHVLLGVSGGMAQELFIRHADEGMSVHRIPINTLYRMTGLHPKAEASDRARAIAQAWAMDPQAFYPLEPLDKDIAWLRILCRSRLAEQNTLRKPVQLQWHGLLRGLRFLLPRAVEGLVETIREFAKGKWRKKETREKVTEGLRQLEAAVGGEANLIYKITGHYANPEFVIALVESEERLEGYIMELLKGVPIWKCLKPPKDSVLPAVLGLGPSLGGAIVAEIGDIRRFPSAVNLRSYARYGLAWDEDEQAWVFPRRVRGQVAPWNNYLSQAVWLWTTDQLHRYESQWRDYYYWRKAKEMQRHSDVVVGAVPDRQGNIRTVYRYTLQHLDRRAKRATGSLLLEYIFHMWWTLERGYDPEEWYLAPYVWFAPEGKEDLRAFDSPFQGSAEWERLRTGRDQWSRLYRTVERAMRDGNQRVRVSPPRYPTIFSRVRRELTDEGLFDYMMVERKRRARVQPEEGNEEEEE